MQNEPTTSSPIRIIVLLWQKDLQSDVINVIYMQQRVDMWNTFDVKVYWFLAQQGFTLTRTRILQFTTVCYTNIWV